MLLCSVINLEKGIKIILSSGLQPLARMGATVTAIDAVDKNIKIASIHAVCAKSWSCNMNLGLFVCLSQELVLAFISTIISNFTIPSVNDSLFLSSQASDPTSASIEYCCATAGTFLPPCTYCICWTMIDELLSWSWEFFSIDTILWCNLLQGIRSLVRMWVKLCRLFTVNFANT